MSLVNKYRIPGRSMQNHVELIARQSGIYVFTICKVQHIHVDVENTNTE